MLYQIFRHPEVEQDLFVIVDWMAEYGGLVAAGRKLD